MHRVLVVDDERIITRNMEEELSKMGYEVVGFASSGEEAVEKARDLRPDVVLMDIVMPGEKDGIDAAEEIRAEMDIPVIFLTAYSDMEFLDRARYAAPFGYLVKPFQAHQLRASIEIALHKFQLEKLKKDVDKVRRETIQQLEWKIADLEKAE